MVILIVEDEILIGWTLKLVLQVGGHRAIGPAASADEALELTRTDRPELAFIDIGIAGERDGIAVASALTEQHGTACIFLTAQADRARTARDVALGVIAKPYDPRDVLHAVDVVAAIRQGQIPAEVPRRLELFV